MLNYYFLLVFIFTLSSFTFIEDNFESLTHPGFQLIIIFFCFTVYSSLKETQLWYKELPFTVCMLYLHWIQVLELSHDHCIIFFLFSIINLISTIYFRDLWFNPWFVLFIIFIVCCIYPWCYFNLNLDTVFWIKLLIIFYVTRIFKNQ